MTWRPAAQRDLPLAALWALGSLCALGSIPLLPYLARLAGPCPLHTLAGIPCPTCGVTRAATALAHGQVAAALRWNPLAAIGLGVGVAGGPIAPAWVLLRGPLFSWQPGRGARMLAVAALAANWIYLVARRV